MRGNVIRSATVQAFADLETRHRMLEGFLLRLARAPDADAFVLRGGMLVRHWFPGARRRVRDVDLVCRLPYDAADLRRRLCAVLSDGSVRDGVVFDTERLRIDPLWPDSAQPGLRLFALGRTDGRAGEMSVDLTFGLDIWPAAERREVAVAHGSAPLWVCRPEMLIGRKLRVTIDLSRRHWRPKDLADVWLMSQRGCPLPIVGEAIERTVPERRAVDELLDRAWWAEPLAAARWGRFRREAGPAVPADLGRVVDEVRAWLSPVMRST